MVAAAAVVWNILMPSISFRSTMEGVVGDDEDDTASSRACCSILGNDEGDDEGVDAPLSSFCCPPRRIKWAVGLRRTQVTDNHDAEEDNDIRPRC